MLGLKTLISSSLDKTEMYQVLIDESLSEIAV
jgi:hypothetical protein